MAGILSLLDELHPASYKDAPFLVNVAALTGGRKTAVHEFPNSNIQNVEDLGLKPRNYKITAIINEPNYRIKRDNLLEALEGAGPGVLIHPMFGRIENMAVIGFTMVEDLKKAGDLEIIIDFAPSNSTGLPVKTANTLSIIQKGEESLFDSITADIGNLFNVTNSFVGNFGAAQDKIINFVDAVNNNVSTSSSTTGEINEFNQLVSNFKSDINTNISKPTTLASGIESIFKAIPGLYGNPQSQFDVQKLFFDFGDDDIAITQNTVARIERQSNNDLLNNAIKGYAVSQSYTSSAQITFNTVTEIEQVESISEAGFQSVKASDKLS